MTTQEKITKEMTIEEILSLHPQKSQKIAMALASMGLQCVGCSSATHETLEAAIYGHGLTDKHLEKMLSLLNGILEEVAPSPEQVHLTKSAADKFKKILEEEGKTGWALRFGDQPGGCSGYEYVLEFSEKAEEDDEVFLSNEIEIHVNKHALPRLVGCEIDYQEGLRHSGFKISNPNAKGCCGCGSSQSY